MAYQRLVMGSSIRHLLRLRTWGQDTSSLRLRLRLRVLRIDKIQLHSLDGRELRFLKWRRDNEVDGRCFRCHYRIWRGRGIHNVLGQRKGGIREKVGVAMGAPNTAEGQSPGGHSCEVDIHSLWPKLRLLKSWVALSIKGRGRLVAAQGVGMSMRCAVVVVVQKLCLYAPRRQMRAHRAPLPAPCSVFNASLVAVLFAASPFNATGGPCHG